MAAPSSASRMARNSFERLDTMHAAGVRVSGLWCEDWVGIRHTSFGARLFWDWKANEDRYPGLRQRIAELDAIAASASSAMSTRISASTALCSRRRRRAGYFATDDERQDRARRFRRVRLRRRRFHQSGRGRVVRRARDRRRTCSTSGSPAGWPISASTCRSTSISPTASMRS